MHDYAEPLAVACAAAREAGALLRQEFHRPGGPRGSGSHADIDEPAERLIRQRLLAAFPWRYLGEETGRADGSDARHVWLVDPNDGTAAFLQGWRGSAVSIAALRDGVPVLGVVYSFAYPDDEGDLIAWAEGCPLTRNGRTVAAGPPPIVFVSQDADRNPVANAECVQPSRYIALPSIAYRLARAAAGDGVAALSLSAPCSWDYAAGHALLRGAGGVLLDQDGKEVTYSAAGESQASACFGGVAAVVSELCRRDWAKVFRPPEAPALGLVRRQPGRAVADSGMLARAQGCLLGQLAGDSLGGLVEFQDPGTIQQSYPQGVRDLIDGGTWGNLAGQPTDDSEMALTLARLLVRAGRYDRGQSLDAYAAWWPHAWDRGNTLRQALREACTGQTSEERLRLVEQHANRYSQSNGSLMRISPLGIFGAGRPAEAAGWAREDSRLTHPNPVCQDACAVFVAAIATAVAEGGTPQAIHEAALEEARRSNVQASVRLALEDARRQQPADYVSQMGWVLIALQNAFYQLLHAESVEEGLVDTIRQGGDTDTTAAIAGALLGAAHGRAGIPSRWLLALLSCRPLVGSASRHPQPMEYWPVDALELAEALLAIGLGTAK